MDEIMSKILKKFVCENGDCRSNEFKIGPLISLIAANILIAASLECEYDGNIPIKPESIKKRLKSIEKNIYN